MFTTDDLFDEILLKQGFMLNYTKANLAEFKTNQVFIAKDGLKECLICLDALIEPTTVNVLESNFKNMNFICLDLSLDINTKWNLNRILQNRFYAI